MPCPLQRLYLKNPPLHIFFMLSPEIILFYPVTKCDAFPHLIRQIRPKMSRINTAKPLNADQSPIFSSKSFYCRQRMRILRPKAVNQIRPETFHYFFQAPLCFILIDFRPLHILIKSEGIKHSFLLFSTGHILPLKIVVVSSTHFLHDPNVSSASI